jgi:C1A family cysteine protease
MGKIISTRRLWLFAALLCLSMIFLSYAVLSIPDSKQGAKKSGIVSELETQPQLSLSGTTFHDQNNDGYMNAGELGLKGWKIRLIQDGKEILNTTTKEKGQYIFNNLKPGTYDVVEDRLFGWNLTAPGLGKYEITLTDKNATNYNFGNNKIGEKPTISQITTHPLMYFTDEQMKEFVRRYNSAPKATIIPGLKAPIKTDAAPKGAAAPPQAAAVSLLPYLSYVPNERNQGGCGNCWVWGSTGVMEIDRSVRKGTANRLSIQFFNSNYNGGSGASWACCGGWPYQFAGFYNDKHAIPWSNANAQYQDGSRACSGSTSVAASSISTTPWYRIYSDTAVTIPTTGITQATAISNIKNVLNQNKAIAFTFFLSDAGWTYWNDQWYYHPESDVMQLDQWCGGTRDGGHTVTCVGYDDSTHSWLMLNSWGTTTLRPNGIFRVDYNMNYNCMAGSYQAFYFETHNIVSSGDGIGVFRPSSEKWYLDFNHHGGSEKALTYGLSTDKPITGDWDYTHTKGIGVYRDSEHKFYLDTNLDGATDHRVLYGTTGDIPLSGADWGSNWEDGIGVYRPSEHKFYLKYKWSNPSTDKRVVYGTTGDIPIVGDWNGDYWAGIGVYRPSTHTFYLDDNLDGITDKRVVYGTTGDIPIAGDWNGDIKTGVGIYRPSTHTFYLDDNLDGITDTRVVYGTTGDVPITSSKG